jgi:NAD(P)-dependent dehydrogenase (short-subunit alcohol dehydrogenase family)
MTAASNGLLTGRTAIVTGGASGIGAATVLALVAAGASVVCADRDPWPGDATSVLDVRADLTEVGSADEVVRRAVSEFGAVDVLVNNVGLAPYRQSFLEVTDADWRTLIDVNVLSMVRMSRAVLPLMAAAGRGSIISLASDAGRQPDPFFVDYAMTKAAVLSISKSISVEFGPVGVRANTVSPGPTATPALIGKGAFAERLGVSLGISREAAIDHFVKVMRKLPLGRLVEPEHVANVIVFLASDLAASVTGSDYAVNAGSMNSV